MGDGQSEKRTDALAITRSLWPLLTSHFSLLLTSHFFSLLTSSHFSLLTSHSLTLALVFSDRSTLASRVAAGERGGAAGSVRKRGRETAYAYAQVCACTCAYACACGTDRGLGARGPVAACDRHDRRAGDPP
eukprot:215744-Pleurochrysis_carterae.AAC.4